MNYLLNCKPTHQPHHHSTHPQEPYRPPTDPALMTAFLEAAREGACWQGRLPELHDVERAARAALFSGAQYDAMLVEGPLNGAGGAAAAPGHPFYLGAGAPRGAVEPAVSGSGSASCGAAVGAYADDVEEEEGEGEGGEGGGQRRKRRQIRGSAATSTADSAPGAGARGRGGAGRDDPDDEEMSESGEPGQPDRVAEGEGEGYDEDDDSGDYSSGGSDSDEDGRPPAAAPGARHGGPAASLATAASRFRGTARGERGRRGGAGAHDGEEEGQDEAMQDGARLKVTAAGAAAPAGAVGH